MADALIFEVDAAELAAETFLNEIVERAGGGGGGQAGGADVGDAVALGVGVAGARIEYEISAQAVGRAQAGAFAEEDEAGLGVNEFADVNLQADAGVNGEDQRGEADAGLPKRGHKGG